jgi:hypothetical protein
MTNSFIFFAGGKMKKRIVFWMLVRGIAVGMAIGFLAGCPSPTSPTPSGDANLASLAVDQGTLDPVFDSETLSYAVTVPYATASITVTAQASHGSATVDNPAVAGKALNVGSNTIAIVVTAEDGTNTKTYTITVAREGLPNDAALKTLVLSAGALDPVFVSGITVYTATVGSNVSSITVTAEPNHPDATVDNPAANGQALVVGDTTITITVTAADGETTKTYTVTVTRPADARLEALALDRVNLQPPFDPDHLEYTASVLYTVEIVTVVTAQPIQSESTVDNPAANGKALTVGSNNTIAITVTAVDGTTEKTYTITVTRQQEDYEPSDDATLKALSLGSHTLSPAFSSGITEYTAAVEYGVSSIIVTAEPNHLNAMVDNPGAESGKALDVGDNTIAVKVTAEDEKTEKTYTIRVTRQAPSTDATLKALSLGNYALNPAFAAGIMEYTVAVENSVSSVTATAEANDPNATVDNPAATAKALTVGGNDIAITVTAEDGTTEKTYTITVIRQALSNDATLKTLALSAGALDPVFESETTGYAVSVGYGVTSITVTVEASQGSATVDNPAANGQALNDAGNTIIAIIVTAPDGETKKTYTITVIRTPPTAPVIRVKEGSTKLTVEWDPVPGATAYEVWYARSAGEDQTPQQSGGDISGSETGYVITGLSFYATTVTGNTTGGYKVSVYAKNSAGRSIAAEWNGELVWVDRLLYQGVNPNGSVEFDTDMRGDYRVIYASLEDDPATAWEPTQTEGMQGDNILVTGLTNGRTYYFWIQAFTDAGGEGDWSSPSVSFTPHIPRPTITQVIPGDESIEVSWDSVSSADSYPVSYEVWYYESASGSPPGTKAAEGLPSSPYVITGLANGTEYNVDVKAKTEYDEMNSSNGGRATPSPVPAAPTALTLMPGIGQIGVSWDAVTDSGVTSYEIYYHTANDSSQAVKYGEVPGTSVVIKGLLHNTIYYVWLRAKNSAGPGFYSAPVSGTTLASGVITVGFDGGLTITDGSGTDVSGGFVLGASGSVTLNADGGFTDVQWYVDGVSAGSALTLNGASYSDYYRYHSVTFTGKKGGILYSSDPIPFRVIP